MRRAVATMAAGVLVALSGCQALNTSDATSSQPLFSASASARPATSPISSPTPVSTQTPVGPPPAKPTGAMPAGAAAMLDTLQIKGRAAKTGYSRDQFGPAWADVDHNGCDTRNDILRRDLADITYRVDDPTCTVATGVLHDPYTGKTIQFVRGTGTSEAVQIDHLVALSDAWQKGAQQWTAAKREAFANDPIELLAVDGPTNEAKGDGDAATWLPPNKAFRCTYVSDQIVVKHNYGLWVTQAEHDAMARVLASCGGVVASPTPVRTTAAPPPPPPTTTVPASVYYANCTAVRAAGKAPLYAGQSGYRSGLDRDHDGMACE